jgi:hypothetical protein
MCDESRQTATPMIHFEIFRFSDPLVRQDRQAPHLSDFHCQNLVGLTSPQTFHHDVTIAGIGTVLDSGFGLYAPEYLLGPHGGDEQSVRCDERQRYDSDPRSSQPRRASYFLANVYQQ